MTCHIGVTSASHLSNTTVTTAVNALYASFSRFHPTTIVFVQRTCSLAPPFVPFHRHKNTQSRCCTVLAVEFNRMLWKPDRSHVIDNRVAPTFQLIFVIESSNQRRAPFSSIFHGFPGQLCIKSRALCMVNPTHSQCLTGAAHASIAVLRRLVVIVLLPLRVSSRNYHTRLTYHNPISCLCHLQVHCLLTLFPIP